MKILDQVRLAAFRALRRVVAMFTALRIRAWLIELLIAVPVALFAHYLWVMGQFPANSSAELIDYVWSTLPVLAISNALPMLGATAVLARYAVSEKPAEALKQISEALDADADRYYEAKGLPLARLKSFRRAMSGAPKTLTFSSNGEQLFTPRPYWDGVWFFPVTPPRTAPEQGAHELTYCAVRVVELVHAVRRAKAALVGGRHGGTNGSRWFLEELEKAGPPKVRETMTRQQAWTWVSLAAQSLHYMREEFQVHRETSDLNEARETEFVDIFCEYMKWLGFFHGKALAAQWLVLEDRYPKVRALPPPPSVKKLMQGINATMKALASVAAANLPRRATAARVVQVRKGVLLPMFGTAVATLTCLSLKPLVGWQPEVATAATAFAYSLIAGSLASNFTFGLWLLVPQSNSPG